MRLVTGGVSRPRCPRRKCPRGIFRRPPRGRPTPRFGSQNCVPVSRGPGPCGKVLRLSLSYSFTESAKPGFSVITARAGGAKGTLGTSKSYREQREPLFHPRTFSLLENCQAIVLPYDGTNAQAATRVYLKPHYLPYWRARDAGQV